MSPHTQPQTYFADSLMDEAKATLRLYRSRLQDAITRVDEAIAAMDIPPTTQAADRGAPALTPASVPRRTMSIANRIAAAKRMKAYWRKRKAGKS